MSSNEKVKIQKNRIKQLQNAIHLDLTDLALKTIEDNDENLANQKDEFGRSLLYLAASKKNIEVVNELIEKNADVNIAIAQAARFLDNDAIELFLENGADVNKAYDGLIHLNLNLDIYVGPGSFSKTVSLLINSGADVNWQDDNGKTILMYAAQRESPIVDLLIKHGADIHAEDNSGRTALSFAHFPSTIKMLTEPCDFWYVVSDFGYDCISSKLAGEESNSANVMDL